MLKELIKISNELDGRGLSVEADYLDGVVNRIIKLSHGELIDFEEERNKRNKRTGSNFPRGEELGAYLIVLDDGETYADEAFVVITTANELEDIWAGSKIYDVVPKVDKDGNPKWKSVWDLISNEAIE